MSKKFPYGRDETPKAKTSLKPKLTDAERHKRFVDMAHEVDADESPEAFDQAFDKISKPPIQKVV